MLRTSVRIAAFLALSLVGLAGAAAQDRGTPDEAEAMAEAAAGYLEAVGPEIAFPAFDQAPQWHDRDLYVFVLTATGVTAAHGANPAEIGLNRIDLVDVNGFAFIQAFLAVEDTGWVDYVWTDPLTGLPAPKRSFIERVGEYLVGVGAYVAETTGAPVAPP